MTRTAYARCPECRFHPVSGPLSSAAQEATGCSRSSGAGETGHNHLLAADNRGKFK
jgi:hypothetical protein